MKHMSNQLATCPKSRIMRPLTSLSLAMAAVLMLSRLGAAQEQPAGAKPPKPAATETETREQLHAQFLKQMNGVKLVGKFTVLGKDQDKLPTEEYEIKSVAKLPLGDKWLFNARIKYGKLDVTLPMSLDVIWSGDTPVITLTDFTIPTLGTFSCRVLIYNGKYAGTWTHGAV
ncbi:MAG: hypothetical protein KDB14_27360, partial [Planctomycetales bacterium]|nr:hypothetical protein [Planctomycetales bacterium]